MKWIVFLAVFVISLQTACAEIADEVDRLTALKSAAENGVVAVKYKLNPTSHEYLVAKQKYAVAENAFNNYTKALLNNYKLGAQADLTQTARLAATRGREFNEYVAGLNLETKNPFVVIGVIGVLVDMGEKFYDYLTKLRQEERKQFVDAIAPQVTWKAWDNV
jgi:hypothetical protein